MEDSKIVALYFQRSERAIDETARKYGPYLHKIAMNILSDREDSRECVNDTYLDAWRSIPPQKPTVLSAYLGKLTRRISIDLLRRRQSAKRGGGEYELSLWELAECVGENSTERAVDGKLLQEAVARYLATLSPDARNAFLCRYFYMDSVRETARICRLSEANTKVLLYRARQGLKAFLQEEGFL